jgi:hypothetical protein
MKHWNLPSGHLTVCENEPFSLMIYDDLCIKNSDVP